MHARWPAPPAHPPACLPACLPALMDPHARAQNHTHTHEHTIQWHGKAPAMARTTRMSSSSPSVDSSSCTSTCHPRQTDSEEIMLVHAGVNVRHTVTVYGEGEGVGCRV